MSCTISQVGEKRLIEEYLRPLFNPNNEQNSIGDDCAAVEIPEGAYGIISTDRVPSDLISYRAGVLDLMGLGRYLGVLNLSDIAACGGMPLALLFNCALPEDMQVEDLLSISKGLADVAGQYNGKVVGGDITSSIELGLSVTIVGYVEKSRMLRRRGACLGDSIFVSRSIGLTPAGLDYCRNKELYEWLSEDERRRLEQQFTSLEPEIDLGRKLSLSNECTSCMDNTDGVFQSLSELARESGRSFTIERDSLIITPLVAKAAAVKDRDPIRFALGPGADFSLVGTLKGRWTTEQARIKFGSDVQIIGTVDVGNGVYIRQDGTREILSVEGWNYFSGVSVI